MHVANNKQFFVSLSSPVDVATLVLCGSYGHSLQYCGAVKIKALSGHEFNFLYFQLGKLIRLYSSSIDLFLGPLFQPVLLV